MNGTSFSDAKNACRPSLITAFSQTSLEITFGKIQGQQR
jgi:hypothetical protein